MIAVGGRVVESQEINRQQLAADLPERGRDQPGGECFAPVDRAAWGRICKAMARAK